MGGADSSGYGGGSGRDGFGATRRRPGNAAGLCSAQPAENSAVDTRGADSGCGGAGRKCFSDAYRGTRCGKGLTLSVARGKVAAGAVAGTGSFTALAA